MSGIGGILTMVVVVCLTTAEGGGFLSALKDFMSRRNSSTALAGVPATTNRPPPAGLLNSSSDNSITDNSISDNSSSGDSNAVVAAQANLNGFVDCVRRCDGSARTCYFRLHVERYPVLGGACRNCSFGNPSDCLRPQCITANGFFRAMIAVNRQLPAPAIQVCRGDRLVVDLENGIPDETVTIHWHGLRQKGSQYYDGVPYVTQCPIQPGSTFRYIFTADEAGTFFYHSHTGIQKMDGVAGALIVRDVSDSQSNLYTDDLPGHVIFVGDWSNRPGEQYIPGYNNPFITQVPDAFLINGRGLHHNDSRINLPLAEFYVTSGRRYRFRLIGATCMTCAVAIKFQGHRVTAISADGNLKFSPTAVDSIILNSADRFDVILNANQRTGTYYIFAESVQDFCGGIRQVAVLRYTGSNAGITLPPPPAGPLGVMLNVINSTCDGTNNNEICVGMLNGLSNAPSIGNSFYAFLFIGFNFYLYNNDDLFAPGTYQHYDEPVQDRRVKSLVNNISFTFPPSPMISQFNDIPASSLCSSQCYSSNIAKPCSCTNFYNLPYNTIINVLVYDEGDLDGFAHPYHLHGYNFYILRQGRFPSDDPQQRQRIVNQLMDQLNNDQVDLRNKPMRDTISVPNRGYVLTRFYSDNPGYWLMHCHFVFHLEAGMNAVFRVGDQSQLPPVPNNFPRCGNYLPPF